MDSAQKTQIFFSLVTTLFFVGCAEKADNTVSQTAHFEQEKAAILATINSETEAAFTRDYERWQEKWVHEPFVTKTYMQMNDSSLSETLGWNEINEFVKTYIAEHPEPEPVPRLLDDIDVRLYGNGAWVSFEQDDSVRGVKRETRLMEKIDGQWKIAGMHTTIYGFQE